jgi:hypothetical protein
MNRYIVDNISMDFIFIIFRLFELKLKILFRIKSIYWNKRSRIDESQRDNPARQMTFYDKLKLIK